MLDHAHRLAAFHREVVLRRGDRYVSPVFAIVAPPSNHGAFDVRRPNVLWPTLDADAAGLLAPIAEVHHDHVVGRARQHPDRQLRRAALILDLEDILALVAGARRPGCRAAPAVRALMYATLSQVTFDSGFGSSCSQPLFALRPSRIHGSGRKTISDARARSGRPAAAGRRPRRRRRRRRAEAASDVLVRRSRRAARDARTHRPSRTDCPAASCSVQRRLGLAAERPRPVVLHHIHRRACRRR